MSEIKINNIVFKPKPIPIPVDYRPMYRISQIILVLKICCRDEKSSLVKLHLFIWAMKNEENMKQLIHAIINNKDNEITFWGMEPSSIRAIDYALQEGVCILIDGKVKLTNKGEEFYNLIVKQKDVLIKEIEFLKTIKKKFTEEKVQMYINKWGIKNAKDSSY